MWNSKWRFHLILGVLALVLSAVPARAGFMTSDPQGDNQGVHDIESFGLSSSGANLIFTANFFNAITDPSLGGSPNDLFGFIDIDRDKNVSTGAAAADLLAARGFGGLPGLGVDYYIDLSGVLVNPGYATLINAVTGDSSQVAISYGPSSITVTVAASLLGGSDDMNAGLIAVDGGSGLNGPVVSDTAVGFSTAPVAVPIPASWSLVCAAALTLAGYRFGRPRRKG